MSNESEREAFHTWCRQHAYDVTRREGLYVSSMTALLWPLWQDARAELLDQNKCPHIVSSDEGTSYCSLNAYSNEEFERVRRENARLREALVAWDQAAKYANTYRRIPCALQEITDAWAHAEALRDAALSETRGEGE